LKLLIAHRRCTILIPLDDRSVSIWRTNLFATLKIQCRILTRGHQDSKQERCRLSDGLRQSNPVARPVGQFKYGRRGGANSRRGLSGPSPTS